MADFTGINLDLLEIQDQRWAKGDFVVVEDLLAELPEAANVADEIKLDLIWNERVWRSRLTLEQEMGCLQQEYCRRFPDLKVEIEREFECEQVLGESFSEGELIGELHPTENSEHLLNCPSIPNHYIIEEFASGGCGVIYRAKQLVPDREVALKLLDHRALVAVSAKDIHQEAERVGQLRHRNIIEVYVAGISDGSPYFTMPLVKCGSLNSRIKEYANRFREIASLMIPVVKAVEYAHELGVLHCDIKPSNILMDGDLPLLADFGMAVSTAANAVVVGGTPAYMAPEQFAPDGTLTVQTDVYGLGAVLYHLLTGRCPGRAKNFEAAVPARVLNNQIPRDLEAICMKCLAQEVENRYASAAELVIDLEQFLKVKPVSARPLKGSRYPERILKWAYRAPWAAAFFAAIIVCLLILVFQNSRLRTSLRTTEALSDEAADNLFKLGALGVERSSKHLAVEPYERSEELFATLSLNEPNSSSYRFRLAKTRKNLASLYGELGQLDKSDEILTKSLHDLEWLETRADATSDVLSELADVHANFGNLYAKKREVEKSLTEYKIAAGIRKKIANDNDSFGTRLALCKSELDLGNALKDSGTRFNEAEMHFKEAIAGLTDLLSTPIEKLPIFSALAGQRPEEEVQDRLQQAMMNLGYIYYGQGRLVDAESRFRKAEEILQNLVKAQPNVTSYARSQAAASLNIGLCCVDSNRPMEGLEKLMSSAQQYRSLVKLEGIGSQSQTRLGECLREICRARFNLAQQSPSLESYEFARLAANEALEVCNECLSQQSYSDEHVANAVQVQLRLGDIAYGASEFDPKFYASSAEHYENALALYHQLRVPNLPEKLQYLDLLNNYGRMSLDHNQLEKSRHLLELGLKETWSFSKEAPGHARIAGSLVSLYNALGSLAVARASATSTLTPLPGESILRDAANQYGKAVEAAQEFDTTLQSASIRPLALRSLFAQATILEQLGMFKESIASLNLVLSIRGNEWETPTRFKLAGIFAKTGEIEQAETTLLQLLSSIEPSPADLYDSACIYAQIYGAILKDPNFDKATLPQKLAHYLSKALTSLESAKKAGYFEQEAVRAHLQADQDFDALRNEKLFLKFVDSLSMLAS